MGLLSEMLTSTGSQSLHSGDAAARLSDDGLRDSLQDPLQDAGEAVQMTANARTVSNNDVENPRHVVDRAESDKTGFR